MINDFVFIIDKYIYIAQDMHFYINHMFVMFSNKKVRVLYEVYNVSYKNYLA